MATASRAHASSEEQRAPTLPTDESGAPGATPRPAMSAAVLIVTCGVWLCLGTVAAAGASFSCASLADTEKTWQHARIGMAPPDFYTGIALNPAFATKMILDARLFEDDADQRELPESFDARRAWPQCPSIGKIVNQGCCGSCWAYASAMAMTDRQCIHAHEHFEYSAEHLLHCGRAGSGSSKPGCAGGDPADAFDYWTSRGVVSGGPYNSAVGCAPYTTPPSGPDCQRPDSPAECMRECQRPYPHSFKADRHFGDRYHLLPFNKPHNMQAEIMSAGPHSRDPRGVYQHVSGNHTGAHAVRLIGWGTEDGVPYWLAVNTWGPAWGERGFFKIRRGVGECKIEGIRVVAGYPVTSRLAPLAPSDPAAAATPPPPPPQQPTY
ncbi:Cathepsin B [Frankliniella fusca]|uniref:Cathepsin B n=1 Tax=Frankliniella fusca TaxID=407009 RepID=A0AAE1LA48_9NEOP|nr:Cathepsin B [Frankliniella fusca]